MKRLRDRRRRKQRKERLLQMECLEPRRCLASLSTITDVLAAGTIYHNPIYRTDVNNDDFVSPIDALIVINELNENGPHELPPRIDTTCSAGAFIDTNGDESVSPIDALLVINELNDSDPGPAGQETLAGWPLDEGAAQLFYYFGDLTSDLPADTTQDVLRAALDVWAEVANIVFTETDIPGLLDSIDFEFVTGDHGDCDALDEADADLAHSYLPVNTAHPLAGDVHFNDGVTWEVGNAAGDSAYDLMFVAVHHIGHALGLLHDADANAVMSETIAASDVYTGLASADIAAMQRVYVPTLAIANASVAEGNAGTTTLSFTVTLSRASDLEVTVAYAIANGSAEAGPDFVAASGTLMFTLGETTKTVRVTVHGDTTFEPVETLSVNLSNPANAAVGTGSATGTITNDDSVPTIAVAGFTVEEGDSGTQTADFTVSLSNASSVSAAVDFASLDGSCAACILTGNCVCGASAAAGSDYVARSGRLTFSPGETSKTVSVTINGETAPELDERFTLVLSNPDNATLSDSFAADGIIEDDDTVAVLTPALTQGPYFNNYTDAFHNRSDLLAGETRAAVINGTRLKVTFNVFELDGNGNATPLTDARVDMWHADADGRYSDEASEGTTGVTFLRGYQFSDASGSASFDSIFPGWYPGRAAHIHFMVRSAATSGALTNRVTSQLFFDPQLTNTIYANEPYDGPPNTTNARDGIYNTQTASGAAGPKLLVTLTPDGSGGYTTTFNVYVQAD